MRLVLPIVSLALALNAGAQDLLSDPAFVASLTPPPASVEPSGPTNDTYGLVGWWPLDVISTGTTPDVFGTNVLTVSGSPSTVTGEITNGITFGGSDALTSPNAAAFNLATFTITGWINTTAGGGEIISRWGFDWEFCVNEGRTDAAGFPGNLCFFNNATWVSSTGTVNSGAWTFIAVVINGGQTTFYINGAQDSSLSQSAPPTSLSAMWFGNRVGGGVGLVGTLDDLRIYSRALTEAEITNQFQWRHN